MEERYAVYNKERDEIHRLGPLSRTTDTKSEAVEKMNKMENQENLIVVKIMEA